MNGLLTSIMCGVVTLSQPQSRMVASLPPGSELNRLLYPEALFSSDGRLVEGVMVIDRWIGRGMPSISGDIRWRGIASVAGGLIIMERWNHFQLCQLLEERVAERLRCIVVHQCRGADVALVVAEVSPSEIHRIATGWFARPSDTEDVGTVTLYFEMGSFESESRHRH